MELAKEHVFNLLEKWTGARTPDDAFKFLYKSRDVNQVVEGKFVAVCPLVNSTMIGSKPYLTDAEGYHAQVYDRREKMMIDAGIIIDKKILLDKNEGPDIFVLTPSTGEGSYSVFRFKAIKNNGIWISNKQLGINSKLIEPEDRQDFGATWKDKKNQTIYDAIGYHYMTSGKEFL